MSAVSLHVGVEPPTTDSRGAMDDSAADPGIALSGRLPADPGRAVRTACLRAGDWPGAGHGVWSSADPDRAGVLRRDADPPSALADRAGPQPQPAPGWSEFPVRADDPGHRSAGHPLRTLLPGAPLG